MIKIFTSPSCPCCSKAKELGKFIEDKGLRVDYFDTSTVDGRAEAVYYDILSTPSVIFGERVWIGKLPEISELTVQ
jgi:glutaredoxin